MRRLVPVLACLAVIACGSDSPTNPSPPAAETRIIALSSPDMNFGIVDIGQSSDRTLNIRNTGNATLTTTGLSGPAGTGAVFSTTGVSATIPAGGTHTVSIRFSPTEARDYSGIFTVQGNQTGGNNTHTFSASGQRSGPLWTASGTGASVFDMPTFIDRVRIVGTYNGRCENFIVRVGGRLLVNVILGTCSVADSRNYDGTHLTTGGVVEVTSSSGINWTFTEQR